MRTRCLGRSSTVATFAGGALLCATLAEGGSSERAGLVTTLEGKVTLARADRVEPLGFPSDVHFRDRIDTAESSLVRMLLGGKALVTVRELSTLTITEDMDKASVDLRGGSVGLEVAKKLLRPGEAVEVRTPNAIAAVRGSFIVVETKGGTTRVMSREVSKPVGISCGDQDTMLESDMTVGCSGMGDLAKLDGAPRSLTAAEKAVADAIQQSPRAGEHDDQISEALKQALARNAGDEVAGNGPGRDPHSSTDDLGVHELAAAGTIVGGPPTGVQGIPEPPVVAPPAVARRGGSAPSGDSGSGVTVNPPPPSLPPPALPPPNVVVVPPSGPPTIGGPIVSVPNPPGGPGPGPGPGPGGSPSSTGPGFSEFSSGKASGANASPTGQSPPAHGLGGGPPPGHSK